jgi:hypothetical protein
MMTVQIRRIHVLVLVLLASCLAWAADTKISALTAAASALGADEFPVNEAGTSKKVTLTQVGNLLFTRIAGSSGAAGPFKTLQNLTANSADQTSTTPGVIMTTTGVGAGTWLFRYTVIYQSAATSTGIKLIANHTGTVTQWQSLLTISDTSATAATGVGKGLMTAAIGGTVSTYPERAKNTGTLPTVGVTDTNADILAVLEGLIVVTVSGSLELKLGTEVGASAVRIMADSSLELTQVE